MWIFRAYPQNKSTIRLFLSQNMKILYPHGFTTWGFLYWSFKSTIYHTLLCIVQFVETIYILLLRLLCFKMVLFIWGSFQKLMWRLLWLFIPSLLFLHSSLAIHLMYKLTVIFFTKTISLLVVSSSTLNIYNSRWIH